MSNGTMSGLTLEHLRAAVAAFGSPPLPGEDPLHRGAGCWGAVDDYIAAETAQRCGKHAGGIPRLGISYACCHPKGHKGPHEPFP